MDEVADLEVRSSNLPSLEQLSLTCDEKQVRLFLYRFDKLLTRKLGKIIV